ncbi:hypothetical protein [Streptomyces sp. RPT161]|uniref:hypothetical protein n=1 Tax=Streptomyces sp. RPT161 TaxID=3015993 RepID=UPI0022B8913D|nr:hypothetical protein [Streptomyces sp. RPT161]
MDVRALCRQLPLRAPVGAFFLNSGLSKRNADEETAQSLHGFASGALPVVGGLPPQRFVRLLSAAELAIGAALLTPVVPAELAGAALTAFSLGTVTLYLRTPGMREPGSLRPTQQGLPLAKDSWVLGIGLSLVIDGLAQRCRRP